ncbi:glycosyltransferase family 25 protein [Proteus faecis]|uniref:glycosyltransferase family 25 protein n=1 Tax=Proteus faecis TaxID=2050967 RepID=UPI000D69680A|nr:glycosyltransferase family 25 protein [Proteus faecis]
MNNFVISLSQNNEKRRNHIVEQFSKKSIPFEFFDAIDKTKINISNALGVTFDNPNLSLGEKGCILSHVMLWKKVIDENLPMATIFEDDIYLSKESENYLKNYDWVNPDWHVIKIERADEKVKTAISPVKIFNKYEGIFRLKGEHLGAGGYIITNKGARYLFKKITSTPFKDPIDYEIFDNFINDKNYFICQFIPALCMQDYTINKCHDKFPSSLENERIHKEKVVTKNSSNKLIREISRVKKQLINLICKKQKERKLPFNMN